MVCLQWIFNFREMSIGFISSVQLIAVKPLWLLVKVVFSVCLHYKQAKLIILTLSWNCFPLILGFFPPFLFRTLLIFFIFYCQNNSLSKLFYFKDRTNVLSLTHEIKTNKGKRDLHFSDISTPFFSDFTGK